MASRHSPLPEQRRRSLNERLVWFVIAALALAMLILKHDGKRMAAPGTAALAAEYADAAVNEYRKRFHR